jgi:hypothetical protein
MEMVCSSEDKTVPPREQMSTIFHVSLAAPTAPAMDAIGGKSWLLRSFVSFDDRVVLCFAAPGLTKDESMGRLFPELKANERNEFND